MLILITQASEKAAETASAGGIGTIGIDARSLILQIINFAILLLLLKKFAYKPIVDILEKRQAKIDESLKTAKGLEQSRKQATEIISTTEAAAAARDKQLMDATNAKINQEVEQAKSQLLQEMGNLVAKATEKVIGHKLTHESDGKIISEAILSVQENKKE